MNDTISGATARTPRPEAMMARGSRVTGSGAAAFKAPPPRPVSDYPVSGYPMTFASLENYDVEIFL